MGRMLREVQIYDFQEFKEVLTAVANEAYPPGKAVDDSCENVRLEGFSIPQLMCMRHLDEDPRMHNQDPEVQRRLANLAAERERSKQAALDEYWHSGRTKGFQKPEEAPGEGGGGSDTVVPYEYTPYVC